VEDRGFLYGDGFFETLRVENGHPHFLNDHLERLRASAQAFRLDLPAVAWKERLDRLLTANGLLTGPAAVKILLTRGKAQSLGLPTSATPTLVIYARPYQPPSPEEYRCGWPVVVFPERRTTFIGRYKSLNYLFYLAARQYALDAGAREALILEVDGRVSEGAATSLLLFRQDRYLTPEAPSTLPGVTLAVLARALQQEGINLARRTLDLAELQQADGLWLVNSLMGVMPASALGGRSIPLLPEITRFLQQCLERQAVAYP